MSPGNALLYCAYMAAMRKKALTLPYVLAVRLEDDRQKCAPLLVAAVSYGEQPRVDAAQNARNLWCSDSSTPFVGPCHDAQSIALYGLSEPGDAQYGNHPC
jgi:hypothetical protein